MKNLIIFFLVLSIISCEKEKPAQDYLGVVNIQVSGKSEAVPHFEKGLLLLHSFEYADSREEFKQAQELDAEMPMAYWGEAMTYNHSLWSEQDTDHGLKVLEELKKVDRTSISDLEKDFLQGVEILYASDSSKTIRDQNYANYMHKLYKKYPDNHEVAAFYSLSLLGSVPDGRDEQVYGQGALIAQGILKENPNHPGALHYLIHSYDDPGHAKLALSAADSYAVVAPDASHALHMPSHIYVALGMWDEVVSSNENSYQASLNRMERKKLDNDARGYHAYHWLEYGYLQQGRKDDAKKLVEDMVTYTNDKPSVRARVHLVFLKGTYLVETEEWQGDIADIPVDITDLGLTVRSQYRFLEGMKAFVNKDLKELERQIDDLEKDHQKESYLVSYDEGTFCSPASRGETSPSMLLENEIMTQQLLALKAWMQNDAETAETHLKKSIEIENGLSYSYGPPVIQKPTHELYGDWLTQQGRTEEAINEYNKTLERAPKRRLATEKLTSNQQA